MIFICAFTWIDESAGHWADAANITALDVVEYDQGLLDLKVAALKELSSLSSHQLFIKSLILSFYYIRREFGAINYLEKQGKIKGNKSRIISGFFGRIVGWRTALVWNENWKFTVFYCFDLFPKE